MVTSCLISVWNPSGSVSVPTETVTVLAVFQSLVVKVIGSVDTVTPNDESPSNANVTSLDGCSVSLTV